MAWTPLAGEPTVRCWACGWYQDATMAANRLRQGQVA